MASKGQAELFSGHGGRAGRGREDYSAKDIEVLEGLEPVRRRPAMYIGGTDERAMHHLAAEVIDNAMDEAVAGHADRIEIALGADGVLSVDDNGRGIPIDPHPKFPKTSALEVILTTLHSGGKFRDGVYRTSGGLHGVGVSVVNALSAELTIEVARERTLWRQDYRRGAPQHTLQQVGAAPNRRGTRIVFRPDPQIFGDDARFQPARLYAMARSKAYLYRGVEIRWRCDPALLAGSDTPGEAVLHYPGGLADYLHDTVGQHDTVCAEPFVGRQALAEGAGELEWAIAWPRHGDGFTRSYCNTIPTPEGGSHESGLRVALVRGLKAYGELVNNRRAAAINAEDLVSPATALLSLFLSNPQFSGQTKEKLANPEASRYVEMALRDHFDHWLSGDPKSANRLLEFAVARAEERKRRREERELDRKTATRRTRLPGKLADCSRASAEGTEIFLVEGDSAGGSAKQARNRETQAVLPLRGKILNVASAASSKIAANQELSDLIQALGCGIGARYRPADLRYDKVVIMTDADVDGAHIASLLMTFFYRQMSPLIRDGHLYLAMPPLYRMSQGGTTLYARNDAHRAELERTAFAGRGRIEISRFKGLGEMLPAQLRETTMNPASRGLLRVVLPQDRPDETDGTVEQLMGRKAEGRFAFIQENARFVDALDL